MRLVETLCDIEAAESCLEGPGGRLQWLKALDHPDEGVHYLLSPRSVDAADQVSEELGGCFIIVSKTNQLGRTSLATLGASRSINSPISGSNP